MPELALLNCRQLVTLAGPPRARTGAEMRELAIIEDGAMLVRDARVAATGTRAQIERLCAASTEIVDAGGRIALPGFVDAHTHPVFAGTRADEFEERAGGATYGEIAARGGGIRATVRRTRAARETELLVAARRYAKWFLRGGKYVGLAKNVAELRQALLANARQHFVNHHAGVVVHPAAILVRHFVRAQERGNRAQTSLGA